MGPVISHASKMRIHGMVKHAVSEGAKLRFGGDFPVMQPPLDRGHYYAPTILEVTPKMEIWREEVC
jgi:acyl-CoA reductase-like NAD-dependent aldehyde dehydrogenase